MSAKSNQLDVGGLAAKAHIRNNICLNIGKLTIKFGYIHFYFTLSCYAVAYGREPDFNEKRLMAGFAPQRASLTSPSETGCLVGVHQVVGKSSPNSKDHW